MNEAKVNGPALRFHPEEPLTQQELVNLDRHRLRPVIEVATNQLLGWFDRLDQARSGLGEPPSAMVMGLLGGLGQGKSTVLRTVLDRLERKRVSRFLGCCLGAIFPSPARIQDSALNASVDTPKPTTDPDQQNRTRQACAPYWRWSSKSIRGMSAALLDGLLMTRKPRILRIDTSLTRPEQLEHKLFSLLLFPHLTWGGIRAGALLLLLLWGVPGVFGQEVLFYRAVDGLLGMGSVAIIALLLPVLIVLWSTGREIGKDWYGNFLDVLVLKAARFLLVTPELLVIDDLDRAKVEQQRAVLRALYKHARMLQCAVVVCFDERELLASKADPDPPEELLRKVLNYAIRIPPRTKEDALLLATGICADWVARNPESGLAGAVAHPLYAADLARVAWLLGQPGPRRIKDLLAHTLMLAVPRGVVRQDDLSALLRLVALQQFLPEAGGDIEYLIHALEGNRQEAFEAYLDGLLGSPAEAKPAELSFVLKPAPSRVLDKADMPRRAKVLHLLLRTRAMQPVRTGWRALIGQDVVKQPESPEVPTAPALWRLGAGDKPRAFCLAANRELERVRLGYGAKPFVQVSVQETVFWGYGTEVSVEAGIGVFILAALVETSIESRLALYGYWLSRVDDLPASAQAVSQSACLREWLADEQVWGRMTPGERQALLARVVEPNPPDFIEATAFLIAATPDDFSLLFKFVLRHFSKATDRDLAAALLRNTTATLQGQNLQDLEVPEGTTALLAYIWPPLQPARTDPYSSIFLPLQALGRLQVWLGHGMMPEGVFAGLHSHEPLEPTDWLPGIQALLKPDDVWRLDFWHEAWRGNVPVRLRNWILNGSKPTQSPVNEADWLPLLALFLADEEWQGFDMVMETAGTSRTEMATITTTSGTTMPFPKQLDPYLTGAIKRDPEFLYALSTCNWFWLDQIPSSFKDIRQTRQGRMLALIPSSLFKAKLQCLRDAYRHQYEEIGRLESLESEREGATLEAPVSAREAARWNFMKAMYETYFLGWDEETTGEASLDPPIL